MVRPFYSGGCRLRIVFGCARFYPRTHAGRCGHRVHPPRRGCRGVQRGVKVGAWSSSPCVTTGGPRKATGCAPGARLTCAGGWKPFSASTPNSLPGRNFSACCGKTAAGLHRSCIGALRSNAASPEFLVDTPGGFVLSKVEGRERRRLVTFLRWAAKMEKRQHNPRPPFDPGRQTA